VFNKIKFKLNKHQKENTPWNSFSRNPRFSQTVVRKSAGVFCLSEFLEIKLILSTHTGLKVQILVLQNRVSLTTLPHHVFSTSYVALKCPAKVCCLTLDHAYRWLYAHSGVCTRIQVFTFKQHSFKYEL